MSEKVDKKVDISIKGRSLMIAIPAYDGKVDIKAMLSIIGLATHAAHYGIALQIAHVAYCSILPKARNLLVAKFMQSECTDFLFLDTDVTFKFEDIFRLMAIATDKDIVGGVYPKKNKDTELAANLLYSANGTPIIEPEFGLYEAAHVATGFMLIRRHVFEKMIAAHPELMYAERDEDIFCHALFDFALKNQDYYGEDYTFCDRARALGFKVYIDPYIKLGHKMMITPERNFAEDIYGQQIARVVGALQNFPKTDEEK